MPTLLEVLQQRFPQSSATTLRKLLKNDQVRVNGTPVRDAKYVVAPDDEVDAGNSTRKRRLDSRISLLFEDRDVIVVEKPAGMLTVPPDRGDSSSESLQELLNDYFSAKWGEARVFAVQRLDRDTSGVLVFARNAFARAALEEQFAAHDVGRTYVAIVRGTLDPPAGTFHSFLAEDASLRVRSVADISSGKEAITHYRTVATGSRYSMLEVTLETGRRNQIRVHLAEAGHPVLGDTMYGSNDEARALSRLALHARDLAFVHPRSGERLSFTVDVPEVMRKLKL